MSVFAMNFLYDFYGKKGCTRSKEILQVITNKLPKKEEVKKQSENLESKESKTVAVKVSTKEEKDTIKAQLKPLPKEKEGKVTMQTRKVCPVKVLTKEEKGKTTNQKQVDTKIDKDEEHRLQHLIGYLTKNKVAFTKPIKMATGLYEMNIIQSNGNKILISVDINGLLYSDEIKFFLGRINVGEEYVKPAIMMTDKSIGCLVSGQQIPNEFFITEQLFNLNKVLDLQTLKEKDPKKKADIFAKVAKAITDPDIYNGILKAANGEAYRFAFSRYVSENEFSIVSSRRNLVSNLGKEKLLVTKEIWINVKGKDIKLTTKSSTK